MSEKRDRFEIHDLSRLGKSDPVDGPTVCRVNDDGSCRPIFYLATDDMSLIEEVVEVMNGQDDLLKAAEGAVRKAAYEDCLALVNKRIESSESIQISISSALGPIADVIRVRIMNNGPLPQPSASASTAT